MIWALTFLLESLGAALNFRHSILFAFLAFASLSEPVTFAIKQYHPSLYCWSWWAVEGVQMLLLMALGSHICGMFVSKHKSEMILGVAFLYLASIVLVGCVAMSGNDLRFRLLTGEMIANTLLLTFVLMGWCGRRALLSPEWKWTTFGLMAYIAGGMLMTLLWMIWPDAGKYYPLGTIAAQVIWIVGPLRINWQTNKVARIERYYRFMPVYQPEVKNQRVM